MTMKNFASLCVAAVVVLFVCACSPCIDKRGFNPDNTDFTKVKSGLTKDQVFEILGAPSSVSTFKPLAWYYVTHKTSTTAFFTPKVIDHQVFVVTFNAQETVKETKMYTGDEAKTIKPVARKTETAGYESGVLREVFSNFGKISTQKAPHP